MRHLHWLLDARSAVGLFLGFETVAELGGMGVEDVEVEEEDAAEDEGQEGHAEVADALCAGA